MTEFFKNLLTASFHGSIVIAVILLLRPLLRKAPRKFICLLWLMAGLRLLIPVEISSPVSLQPEPITRMPAVVAEPGDVPGFVPEFMFPQAPRQEEPVTRLPQTPEIREPEAPAPEAAPEAVPQAVKQPVDWMELAAWVWLAVMGGIALFSLGSYIYLRRRVREAVRVKEGIWVCDRISTAFILGYFRPRIYIPMGISRSNCRHILAHERTHLEKGDHWFKLIGFITLTVHWFNPMVWLAYVLLCKDIEVACDERVVQFMDLDERKSYSSALVACSVGRGRYMICPVAFGEVSVKERVHRVLKYKKPSFWISLAAVLALIFVAVCFMTSPSRSPELTPETTGESTEETVPQVVAAPEHDLSDLPEDQPETEYVDPNGHGLRLYIYGQKPTGAKIGLSMGYDPSIDYDAQSKLGRGMTFTEEYWLEQEVDGSWQKLKTGIEPSFGSLIYNLGEQHYEAVIDWTDLYGKLYDGHFRLGKNLEIDGGTCTYYGEFYIMDNDPIKEPEVHLTIDRIHAALDEIKSRECVHVVTLYDGVSEAGGEGSGQNDMIWSGSDYIQSVDETNWFQSTGKHQNACYNGISYTEYEGQWYSAGSDQFFFAGNGWDYEQRLDGWHVTLNGQGDILDSRGNLLVDKISLTLDRVSDGGSYQRIFRDYSFDSEGKLTHIDSTTYYRSNGQLYKRHNVSEIYPAEKSELTTRLEAVVSNAGNHTYEEYDQLMREKNFDEDFSLGAGSFVWRQDDWAYRIGGEEGSATATGMMVYHEYCGGESQGSVYTQGGFWLEKLENEKWSRVPMPAGNPQPSSEPKLIFDNTNGLTNPTRMRCDWSDSYGTLEPGFYRVAQNYKLTTTSGEENIKTCYAKFRVYDPNGEIYLAQVRQGLTDILNRDSYYIEVMKDYYGVGNREENEHDIRLENIWKKDNQNYVQTNEAEKFGKGMSYSLLLNGKGYFSSGEPGSGWEYVGHFNRETFEFWQISGFDMYDSLISTVEKDGNVVTVNQDLTEYKRKFIYTFDDAGRLVEGQSYLLQGDSLSLEDGPVLTDEFKVKDVTEAELERIFAKCDITKPATFSFAEDEKLFANYGSWKTSGFKNTSPVTISSAQEAEERAKNDCTLPVLEDENGFHEGGWNLVKAFFDPDAQLWKVEFTMSQGGVYQAVYMTADGVTTNVVG